MYFQLSAITRSWPNTIFLFVATPLLVTVFIFFTLFAVSPANATTLEQAKRLHDRIVGVPASEQTLNEIKLLLDNDY
jgi:hypothetical protein